MEESADLERRKLEREIEKLEEEIAGLRRPWWQHPAYWSAIIPALVAIVALGGSLGGAWILTGARFEKELHLSQGQISKLSTEATSLRKTIGSFPELDAGCEPRKTEGDVPITFSRNFSQIPIVVASPKDAGRDAKFLEVVHDVDLKSAKVFSGNARADGSYQFCWYAMAKAGQNVQ